MVRLQTLIEAQAERLPHFNCSIHVSSNPFRGAGRPLVERGQWPVISAGESFMFKYGSVSWWVFSVTWDNDR